MYAPTHKAKYMTAIIINKFDIIQDHSFFNLCLHVRSTIVINTMLPNNCQIRETEIIGAAKPIKLSEVVTHSTLSIGITTKIPTNPKIEKEDQSTQIINSM